MFDLLFLIPLLLAVEKWRCHNNSSFVAKQNGVAKMTQNQKVVPPAMVVLPNATINN